MKNFYLTDKEKSVLLKIARDSIKDTFDKNKDKSAGSPDLLPALTDNLKTKSGVFVTLKTNGEQLRGCIGNFVSDVPVYKNVYKMAKEAAFGDPRFVPLSDAEFKRIKIEISVLSPLEKINDLDAIEIGKHGLYIVKGSYRGVLLPQVAVEYKMNRKDFLEAVSVKAGLSSDAYKSDADIYVFSAVVFNE